MYNKAWVPIEALSTLLTFIRFLPSVGPFMYLKWSWRTLSFPTAFALIRGVPLCAGMCLCKVLSHMKAFLHFLHYPVCFTTCLENLVIELKAFPLSYIHRVTLQYEFFHGFVKNECDWRLYYNSYIHTVSLQCVFFHGFVMNWDNWRLSHISYTNNLWL